MSREYEAGAERRARAMIEMVHAKLPITASVTGPADAWQLVAPALIARQVGALEAIFALRPLGRDADATVL